MQSINPATGQILRDYPQMSPSQAAAAVDAAHAAFLTWRTTGFEQRAALLHRAAELLHQRARDYAELMALEMGKPVEGGVAEAEKCAGACRYFADYAARFLADEVVETGSRRFFVAFRPLGVVLAVMPWNFPFWQVIRFAAPALMAGNAAVLKHASNVPGCALALEQLFRDAGFPPDLFRTLMVSGSQVDGVLEHPKVMAATLTGSGPAGRAVAAKAGSLLKKTVLELGGSDAYIVLEDAGIASAAAACAKGRLVNSGQSCIAAKRFVVVEAVRAEFERHLVAEMQKAVMGDPRDKATTLGPMARRDLRDDLHRQVQDSIAKGARLLTGGTIPPGPGAFYPPTVLTDVRPGMPAYDAELFGPVAAVIAAKDEADAVRIANDSVFGLGGGVFTGDLTRGERLAVEAVDAGAVFVNATVQSDQRLPFGGIKQSGYGRELSAFGIREFVNVKTIVVASQG